MASLALGAFAARAHAVVNTDLIGYYRFDSDAYDSFGKQDGTLMEFTNGGTQGNTDYWHVGRFLGALDFNGTTEWVKVPDNGSNHLDGIHTANRITIATWIYWRGGNGQNWQNIASRQIGTTASEHFTLSIQEEAANDNFAMAINTSGGYTRCASTTGVSSNTWVHVAGTWDGATIRSYINGVEVCATARNGTMTASDTTPLIIGGNANGSADDANELFYGMIDEVTIWKRALSATEILQLATGAMPEITKYWTCADGNICAQGAEDKWSLSAGGPSDTTKAWGPYETVVFTDPSTYSGGMSLRDPTNWKGIQINSSYAGTIYREISGSQSTGLSALYYSTASFGSLVTRRVDNNIDFASMETNGTDYASGADDFAVVWTGQVRADATDTYTFYTYSDDGIKLTINDVTMVDSWINQDGTTQRASHAVRLEAGRWYEIGVTYYDATGGSKARVLWSRTGATTPVAIPQANLRPPPFELGSGGFTMAGGGFVAPETLRTLRFANITGGTFYASSVTSLLIQGNLTFGGGTWTDAPGTLIVGGDFAFSAGTFQGSSTMEVLGRFNRTGGSFSTTPASTVLASGNNQTLTTTGATLANLTIGRTGSTTNLVGHWKLDETPITANSTVADDISSSNADGQYVSDNGSSPTSSTDVPVTFSFGNTRSVAFTGGASRQAVKVTSMPAALKPTAAVSVSVWYKASALDTDNNKESELVSAGDAYLLRLARGELSFTKHVGASVWKSCEAYLPDGVDGVWHHVVAMSSASGMAIYVDGVQLSNAAISDCANTQAIDYTGRGADFYIARHGTNSTVFDFTGSIDDVRVYSAALTESEVRYLYLGSQYPNGGGAATQTLGGALTTSGDLTVGAGTLNTGTNYAVNVGGSFTSAGTFTGNTSTVTLNGTTSGKSLGLGGGSIYNLTVNGTNGVWTLSSNLTVTNAVTLTAGTLNGGSATLTVPGSWSKTSGVWQAGTGTVALTGSGAKTVPNETFNNLTINNGSGTYTTQAALTVGGDLTITAGSLGTTASNHAINLGGSLSNSGTFSPGSSVITLNGTAGGKTFTPGVTIAALTVNGSGGAWTLGGDTTVSGDLTLTNGTLNGSTRTLTVGGNWSRTSGTFNADTGTVSLTGSGARSVPSQTWNNLTLANGTFSTGGTMTVGGNLTVSSGSLAPSANTVNVGGNFTATGSTFTPGTSTIVLNGGTAGKTFSVPTVHHLQVNGSGGWALQQALTVNGDFTLTTGTLDLNGHGLSVKGSLLRNGGTFTTGASTVTLNGTATGKSLTLGGASINTLTINGTGGEWALTGATSVGTINLQAGTLKGGNQTLTVSGSWSNTGGTFTPETSTVVFSGSGTNSVPGQTFYSLTFDNASGTYNLQNALALDGDLTINAGTFNTNNNTVSVKGSFINAGTLNAGTTVLTLNGTSAGKTLTTGGATLAGLTVSGLNGGWTLGSTLTVSGDLAISNGTLAQSTHDINVGGNWNRTGGTFTKGTGTAKVTFTATSSGKTIRTGGQAFNHLTFNGASGGWTLQDAADVDGDLTLTNGTFATGNFAVNVAGSLTRTSGTFSPGTSLITLDGTATGKTLNPGVALDRLTVSGSGGEWTLGAATTVTNALNVGPGTLKTGAYGLTNSTTTTAANVASGGTVSVDGNGSATLGAGATVASGGALALTATSGQTSTVNVGSGKTLTVNGTLTATTTGTKTIQASSGYYAFTVNGSGSAAVLNVDGLEVKNTDANGLTINSASAATFTSFKNVAFTGGNPTASRYLSIDANALNAFFEGLTFDAATTSNVRLVGHGSALGRVRLTLRANSAGAGAGESRDIDDDANGDDVPDNAATDGAVVQWVDYYTDMAGSASGFAVPAFDWNTFSYYATYVAMRDHDGSNNDYIYVRNVDGSAKGYGASIPSASGDIMGPPRPVQTGNNRYLLVLTTKSYVYKYQDTGAALTLLTNWPYTGGGNCNVNAQSPLIATSQFAYWTCNASTASNKIINKLDHTTANPNTSSLTQTQYSTTANTATATPVLGTVSNTEYVYYVAQGAAFGMPTATMSGPLSDTTNQPSTAVSGRLSFADARLYFADDNGKLWVKKADTLAQNHWTCQDLANHGGVCNSTNCKIANFTVGFKLTNTTTYPRVYWGDADGHVYVAYDDLGGGCAFLGGFPFQPSGSTAITAAPVFNLGNIIVGNTAGELFVINQRNASALPEVIKTYALGSAITSISLDRANSKYIVLAGTRAFYLPMYTGTDTGDPAAPVPPGYFVLTDTTYTGGFGSRAAADTICYDRMVATTWLGKPATINAAKVKAFLCDQTTCNNLAPNTTYKFAVMGSATAGGASFTTDSSGAGPNDTNAWNTSDRFNASPAYWTNRSIGTNSAWGLTPHTAHCSNLTSNGSQDGLRGQATGDGTTIRWHHTTGNNNCSQSRNLICFLDP